MLDQKVEAQICAPTLKKMNDKTRITENDTMPLSDITEATPETTSDDIREYAEQVFKEVEADRQGEPEKKSDAQITNEQAGTPQPSAKTKETPAETNSGSDTATEDGEETGDVERPEWMTDGVKAEAAAYGLEESELADFASREELDRALRLFDKTALEAGRKALAESEKEDSTRNEKGQFVKKEEPKTEPTKEQAPRDGRYQVSLSTDLYDEEIIGEFNRLVDHYESRFAVFEKHFAEASAKTEEQQFDSVIDSLGHADLFGKTGKESEKELERRRDLHVAVKAQMIGLERLGRPTELSEQLISRVANMVFGEELGKKRLKQQTSKISRQSQMRQGGSPTKPLPPRDNPRDEADRLYKELAGS
jgi:hypothetical protein